MGLHTSDGRLTIHAAPIDRVWIERLEPRLLLSDSAAPSADFGEYIPYFLQHTVLAPDGKVYVAAGVAAPKAEPDGTIPMYWGVARFNSDRTPDTAFGSEGLGTAALVLPPLTNPSPWSRGMSEADQVLPLSDGRAVVIGLREGLLTVARFNVDGSLDPTFGGAGTGYASFGEGGPTMGVAPWGHVARLTADGGILILDLRTTGVPPSDLNVFRLNADGTPDLSFGPGGLVTDTLVPADCPRTREMTLLAAVPTAEGGAIAYFLDSADAGATWTETLERIALDPTGHVVSILPMDTGASKVPTDLAIAADRSVYVCDGPWRSPHTVLRFTPDGQLDDSFGQHGVVSTPVSHIVAMAPTADGKLLLLGDLPDYTGIVVTRLAADGSVDPTFVSPVLDPGLPWSLPGLLLPLADGSIVLPVATAGPRDTGSGLALLRIANDGEAPSLLPFLPPPDYWGDGSDGDVVASGTDPTGGATLLDRAASSDSYALANRSLFAAADNAIFDDGTGDSLLVDDLAL